MKKTLTLIILLAGITGLRAQPVTAYILMLHGAGCDDQSGMLVAQGAGGVGNYTYLWSDGSTNDTISGIGAGTYTVTVTSGTASDDGTVTLDPFGIESVNVVHACSGDPGLIYLDNINATYPCTIQWSDCDGNILQTGISSQLSGLQAGCYNYNVVDAQGCIINGTETVYASTPVLEAFVSDSALCYGESAQIWYTPGLTLSDNWGITYDSSTDTITYINQMGSVNSFPQYGVDSLGCEAMLESNNIFVYQQGHPDPVQIYGYGDTISTAWGINLNPSTTNIYIWRLNGVVIDTSVYSYLPIDTSGFYSVSIVNQYGCSVSGTIQVEFSGVGIEDVGTDGIAVSGNPSRNDASWVIDIPSDLPPVTALLTDASGRNVLSRQLIAGRHALGQGLPTGLYLLKLADRTIRLVKD